MPWSFFFFVVFIFRALGLESPLTLFTGQLITWLAELEGRGLYAAIIRGSKVIADNIKDVFCSVIEFICLNRACPLNLVLPLLLLIMYI